MLGLRVITFNIQNGQIWDPVYPDKAAVRIDLTAQFLAEQNADIILLQEIESPPEKLEDRSTHPHYDYLQNALPNYWASFIYPAAKRPHLPFGIGLSIFSRYELKDSFHIILPPADISFDFRGKSWMPTERSILGTYIQVENQRIQILNTHLQSYFMIHSSSDAHPAQRQILETLLSKRQCPTILGGDFNCNASETTIAGIESTGMIAVQKAEPTWHRMPLALDHLFYSPEFSLAHHAVIRTNVSDHDAVLAEINL